MTHARGLYKPQATSEHGLHTKRFVGACSVHWYLLVPSAMKIATCRGLFRWLAGWPPFRAALRPRSKRTHRVCVLVACACALHCGYTWNKFQRAACLSARERTSCWRGRIAQRGLWAMCITTTSRFTVSIILVVITTLKERRVVAAAVILF